MTTVSGEPVLAPRTTVGRWRALSAWAGIAFAPVLIVGSGMAFDTPDTDASDARWLAWYAIRKHRVEHLVGAYLLILAALLFLAFAAGLLERLRAVRSEIPVLHLLSGWTAAVSATLMMVAAITAAGVDGNISFGGAPVPTNADLLRQNIGFPFLGVTAAISAAVFIAAATALASRAGLFPRWLVTLSYVFAVILLFGTLFFPLLALPLWMLIAGIALLRRGAGSETGATPYKAAVEQGTAAEATSRPTEPAL